MDNISSQDYFEKLYQRAENWLSENAESLNTTLPLSVTVLLQELSIHRVELEMQNEELRDAQAYIESSRDEYKTLFDFSPAGCVETDIQGRIINVNQSFCAAVNYDKSKILNLPFSFFVSLNDRDRYYNFINRLTNTGGRHNCNLILAGKGISSEVIIQGVFANEYGNKRCLLSVIELNENTSSEDLIREQVSGEHTPGDTLYKKELALKKALSELEQANKELEEFTSIMSHDLQEPVRIIESLCQLLILRYKDRLDERGEDLVRIIVDGAVKIRDLVNELLNLSRVNTIRKPFEYFDAEDVLITILNTLILQISQHEAVLTHDHLPRIFGDKVQFEILLQNLIANAFKYHKQGELPRVHISSVENETEWLFSER